MYGQHMCTLLTEFRRGCLIPCFYVIVACESHYGCLDSNMCSQEESCIMLLTIEQSLQPRPLNFFLGNLPLSCIILMPHLCFSNLVQYQFSSQLSSKFVTHSQDKGWLRWHTKLNSFILQNVGTENDLE